MPAAPAPAAAVSPPGLPPAATPATRRLARELGVDLARVRGTGPGGRVSDEDVRLAAGGRAPPRPLRGRALGAERAGAGRSGRGGPPADRAGRLPALPRFEQWGPVEREPLRGIRRRSAEHLSLAWAVIPHVTQHDQADVTELETMRRRQQKRGGEGSARADPDRVPGQGGGDARSGPTRASTRAWTTRRASSSSSATTTSASRWTRTRGSWSRWCGGRGQGDPRPGRRAGPPRGPDARGEGDARGPARREASP